MAPKTVLFLSGMAILLGAVNAQAVQSLKVSDEYDPSGKARIRVEGILEGSPESIWNFLIRFNDYARFMPHVVDSFFISEEGLQKIRESMKVTMNPNKMRRIAKPYAMDVPRQRGRSWEGMVFMELDAPFPVENRWYVIHTVQDETKFSQKTFQRCWTYVVGNIKSADGCWILRPSGDLETFATYVDNVNPGGNVPKWLSRMAAHETMPDVFRALEKQAVADLNSVR